MEATIAGEFTGWNGETLIKLTNGQIWEQAQYHYEYLYAYRPHVMIYPGNGGHLMKVDGCKSAIPVRRVR